jgi:hypothetical protein
MRTIQAGVLVLAGVFVVTTAVKSQAPAAPPAATVWEYSSVTAGLPLTNPREGEPWTGRAEICYGNSVGCRVENVTSTSDNNNLADPMLKAATQLGSQGWELTSVIEPAGGSRTFYFRRPANRTR